MTNRELAEHLGISPSALSIIINNKKGVSEKTRAKVIRELKEMGYGYLIKKEETILPLTDLTTDNGNICFLIYKKTGKILSQHPYFMLLTETLEECSRKYGYNLILKILEASNPLEPQLISIQKISPSGIILFATEMQSEDLSLLKHLDCPLVALDNIFDTIPVDTVAIDNIMGTFQAIEYLHQQGHIKIGYLTCADSISSFEERKHGYHVAMNRLGITIHPEYEYTIPYSELESYREMSAILGKNPQLPTAFVCDDDTIAMGAMRALLEYGYRIPEDISIIGFNDRPTCEATIPPLTSVNVPRSSFAAEAIRMLIIKIKKAENNMPPTRSLKLRVGTQLIIRDSVACIK